MIVRCRPERCAGCGAGLPVAGQRRVGSSQVVELPPVRPVVVEAWRYAARGRACGGRTVAQAPAGLEPGRAFGPGVEATVAYLHERHHLGYTRLVELGRDVLGRAIRLHHDRGRVSPATFARRRTLVERATDRLVFGPPLAPTTEARRLQQRYQAHRARLDVFLERDDVEPTNNAAERDLRTSVIHRKVTGGYRSAWGTEASAIVTSLLATARKRGDNLYAALRAVAGPPPLHATGIAT